MGLAAAVATIQSHQDAHRETLGNAHSLVRVLKSWGPVEESVECLKRVDTFQRLRVDRYVQPEIDALHHQSGDERLGVDRYVQPEIDALLRDVYRSWQQKEEGIFGDPGCLAMAFRILRMKGYNVKPGKLTQYTCKWNLMNSYA
ncbi:hypothetical protein M569_17195 [Genlisea aurea]|uniref:Terpene synthase N-terminal domain-containing protein n=1 Tax=Genlisea aurea TaxID=192259 RepID=S8DE21_9LAMI|nr:hypothetical protein M569_17195 [Genlisea aurea]